MEISRRNQNILNQRVNTDKILSFDSIECNFKKRLKKVLKYFCKHKIIKDFHFSKKKLGVIKIHLGLHNSIPLKKLVSLLFSNAKHSIRMPYFLKMMLHKLKIFNPECFRKYMSKFARNQIKHEYPFYLFLTQISTRFFTPFNILIVLKNIKFLINKYLFQMFPPLNKRILLGTIHNHSIFCERVQPKISKKFSTSVHQFNIYLKQNSELGTIQLNSQNIDALRDILNKFYSYATQSFDSKKHNNIYFQMNVTLKGKQTHP